MKSQFFNLFEKNIPYLLPILLIVSRTTADLAVVICSLVFLMRCISINDWKWTKETWFIYALIFFSYLFFINAPLSINPTDSALYSVFFLRWPLFAIAIYWWIFKENSSIKKFIISSLIVLSFLIFDVWYQFFFDLSFFGNEKYSPDRLTGPYERNPVPGIFILRFISILLSCVLIFKFLKSNARKSQAILTILFIGFMSVFITGERMTFMLYCSTTFLILIGLFLECKNTRIFILLSIFSFLIFGFYFILTYPITAERAIFSTIEKILELPSTDYGAVYRTGISTWLENPIFGGGLHQFRDIYPLYGPKFVAKTGIILHAHSITIGLLVETGVIGLFLYYIMVFQVLKKSLTGLFKENQWLKIFIILNLIHICFWPIMSGFSFSHNWIGAIVWFIVGWSILLTNKKI